MQLSELIRLVRQAGVTGAGGAGFPAWRKIDCQGKADTLLVNGAECEPLLYADYYAMQLYGDRLIAACLLLGRALDLRQIIIAVKQSRKAILDHLARLAAGVEHIQVFPLPEVYPSGDEHILTWLATRRAIPQGGLPLNAGVLVHNVQTLIQIGQAAEGHPVTSRFVSIGGAVRQPLTAEVPAGTPAAALLEAAGGPTVPNWRLLAGGIMMGELMDPGDGIQKTTSGILVLPNDHPAIVERTQDPCRMLKVSASVCDQCYTCTEYCPRRLLGHDIQPHLLMRQARRLWDDPSLQDGQARYCCECGVCSLVACPLQITPRRIIAGLKRKLPPASREPQPEPAVRDGLLRKQLPLPYIMKRLALSSYAVQNIFIGELIPSPVLKIALREFGGSFATPAVRPGQRVIPGEVLATGKWTCFHSPVHAIILSIGTEAVLQRIS